MSKMIFDHPVLDYFSEISQIPRGSGNEQAISDWMVAWAKAKGLFVMQDQAKNVLIRKPASPGYESAPALMLQGHLDMVCEKVSGSDHDFLKDPIEFIREGDTLRANGTTLGADNGIGLAYILAVLDDDAILHPELECLMTSSEEVGMLGVKALDNQLFQLKSKVMINLDAGGEGVFFAGCAGGGRCSVHLPIQWENIPQQSCWEVRIEGLHGGHSGADIHLQRANANVLMGRVLHGLAERIRLVSISGGSKENAIPRDAVFCVACDYGDWLKAELDWWQKIFRVEYEESDPDITLSVRPAEACGRVYDLESQKKIISALYLIPCGIFSKNLSMDKVVTSSSLGVVTSDDEEVCFHSGLRSSMDSEMYTSLVPKFEMAAELLGASLEKVNFYSGWQYDPNSRVGALAAESYRKFGGAEPVTTMLHAGLECGLLMGILGQIDCIAMAPEINDCHGPSENCSISSVMNYFEILKDLLSKLN